MQRDMHGLSENFKVRRAIVEFIPIFVMDNLASFNKSSNFSTHYNTMFKCITVSISGWMAWTKYSSVALYNDCSTFPIMVFNSAHRLVFTIVRTIKYFSFTVVHTTRPAKYRSFAITTWILEEVSHIQYYTTQRGIFYV